MDKTLITILINDIAVPELLALVHRSLPTDATITVQLSKDTAGVKAIGQAFLDATRTPTPPPVASSGAGTVG